MTLAGIDASVYRSHSTTTAAASFLASRYNDLKDIMKAVSCTNEETFHSFYNCDVIDSFNFRNAILTASNSG